MNKFMEIALNEAKKAYKKGEVPIGAVIVKDGKVVSKAHNLRECGKNSLKHAEIIAIDRACKKLGGWRLWECDLYVTLEPCCMCGGAIIQSRIRNLYFGAYDYKGGCIGSIANILEIEGLNHNVRYTGGIMKDECSELIKMFFKELRSGKIKKSRNLFSRIKKGA